MKKLVSILIVSLLLLLLLPMLPSAAVLAADTEKRKEETQPQPQTEVNVTYEIIQQGTYSGVKEPLAKVITDSNDWTALWKKHVSLLVPQPPSPEIDFQTAAVVAIFAGEKRTGGYQVLLQSVTAQGDDIVVRYRLVEPAQNSFTIQVLSQPFVMLKISKPKGTVKLLKE